MPYTIKELPNGQWQLVKKDDGKVMGTHSSKAKALAQERAIYASEARRGKRRG